MSTVENDPQVKSLSISLDLSVAARARIEHDGPVLFRLAQDCLRDEPDDAAALVHVARLLVKISCLYDVEASHPENRKRKPSPPATRKVKHIFGEGGACVIEHVTGVACATLRQRAKRGTAAESPPVQSLPIPGVG
jgi:hypothetical protein